jgi:hypothetical protein
LDDFVAALKSPEIDGEALVSSILPRTALSIADSLKKCSRIFVSYRREDTEQFVGRVCDRLEGAGHEVLIDIDAVHPGLAWRDKLRELITSCDVMVALIGKAWASERFFEDDDPVRMEIALAIELEKTIIPILANRASMPTNDKLPQDIHRIRDWQAADLDYGTNFNQQTERLLKSLGHLGAGG